MEMTHEAATEVEERGEGNAEAEAAGMDNSGFVKEDSPPRNDGSKSGEWRRRFANCKLAYSHSHSVDLDRHLPLSVIAIDGMST